MKWPRIHITAADIGRWPFFPGALVKLAACLRPLTWPSVVEDLGLGGFLLLSFLFFMKDGLGKDLGLSFQCLSIVGLGVLFRCRLLLFCPDSDIRNLCQYFATMMRALCCLPGGIGRFTPGRIGANHSRLRHVGWQKCCHGLSCRPLETSGEGVLSDLLVLIGYLSGSGAALLRGNLWLKYQTLSFAKRKPTWRIPSVGGVANIIAAGGDNIDNEGDVFVVGSVFPW